MKQITLNIGGEDRVFYFGLGFLGNLLEIENISISDFDELEIKNPVRHVNLLMYHSLAWGYIRKNEECPFNKLDVMNWIDDSYGVVEKFKMALKQSFIKDVPIQPEDKKKVKAK